MVKLLNKFEVFKNKILVFDGAMGTQLQTKNFPVGVSPESWNLEQPHIITEIHRAYFQAGCNVVTTNTFGGNRIKLKEFNMHDKLYEINRAAVECAKSAVFSEQQWVAGSMGPTGKFVEPLGDVSFDEMVDVYREQAIALATAGADVLIIETSGDIGETRAAVIAAKEYTNLPIIASLTFNEDMRTFTGTDPEAAAIILEGMGIDLIGANCSGGPAELFEIAKIFIASTHLPIIIQPNAGLPRLEKGHTVFDATPQEMAEYAKKMAEHGVAAVGACCGSSPAHISEIAIAVRGYKPLVRIPKDSLRLASRTKTLELSRDSLPIAIGERINPTGRKALAEEIKAGKMDMVRQEAIEQTEAGAAILDVNIGVPGIDQALMMKLAIDRIQTLVDTPLMIDTTDPIVLEIGLKQYHGKALINSVNGEEKSLQEILPLAKKYGAAVVALTLDDNGLPKSKEKRIEITQKIVERASENRIGVRDIIVDCLVMTASAQPQAITQTLEAIPEVRKLYGVTTILGVSNVSFGLPNRELINKAFFAMALGKGLDAGIINPLDQEMMTTLQASAVLADRDAQAMNYIDWIQNLHEDVTTDSLKKKAIKKSDINNIEDIFEKLKQTVITGDKDNVIARIEVGLNDGHTAMELLDGGLIPGIEEVGQKYAEGVFFLPQLMLAGETMTASFKRLEPELQKKGLKKRGKVVMATVKGDIHDIGKNIVCVLLANHGFEVIDLGKNVDTSTILDVAEKENADIIGLSALMTTTMTKMPELIEERNRLQQKQKVIVGGAVVTKNYASEIGADGYALDAVAAVNLCKELLK